MKDNVLKIITPKTGVNDDFLMLMSLFIKSGDFIEKDQKIASLESSKEAITIDSSKDGYFYPFFAEGEEVRVGSVFGVISEVVITNIDEVKNEILSIDDIEKKDANEELQMTKKARLIFDESILTYDDLPIGKILMEKDIINLIEKKTKNSSKSLNGDIERITKSSVERVVVIGAGKGSEVVIDILLDDFSKIIVGLVDDNVKEMKNYNFPILSTSIDEFPTKIDRKTYDTVIISIGADYKSMKKRKEIYDKYKEYGINFTNAISKSAIIRKNVSIGEGNVIGDLVYIGTQSMIGSNNSISYRATIGHHNVVGDSNLIAPNFCSSGSVEIGSNCILPAGVTTINRVKIGSDVILPLGYIVLKDIKNSQKISL